MPSLIPILLAGGEGKRLGPLGTQGLPKQFHEFNQTESLLQQSACRALQVARAEHVVTVTSQQHVACAQSQLATVNALLTRHLIAEPMPRNTAAAVTLAAQYAMAHWENPVIAILPVDHYIADAGLFATQVREAAALAEKGAIVLFGITPASPSPHYGYVMHAESSQAVTAFHEKPATEVAAMMMETGRAYWNSGMFVMRADICLEEMRTHSPDIFLSARDAALALSSTPEGWKITESRFYETLSSLPIDKAIMEKSTRLTVLPFACEWADLGTPEEAARVMADIKN